MSTTDAAIGSRVDLPLPEYQDQSDGNSMSYDLVAWKAPRVTDEEEAARLVKRYFESDDATPFGVSSDVEGFYADLMKKYPLPDPANPYHVASDQTQWAIECEPSDRVLVLSLSWSTPGEIVDEIVALARARDLVLFDPQGDSIYSPELPLEPEDIPGQVRQALGAGAAGAGIFVAAFYIPWRILSWPIMAASGFLVVMSIYTLVVLWKPEWQPKE